jgi:hypothetical protein
MYRGIQTTFCQNTDADPHIPIGSLVLLFTLRRFTEP